jgi:hypothetical protein
MRTGSAPRGLDACAQARRRFDPDRGASRQRNRALLLGEEVTELG